MSGAPIAATHYTPAQAAAALQVALRTIYAMVDAGRLAVVRVGTSGRTLRIPRHEIDNLATVAAPQRPRLVAPRRARDVEPRRAETRAWEPGTASQPISGRNEARDVLGRGRAATTTSQARVRN